MQDSTFDLYDWLMENVPGTKYNLSQSGMNQVDISKIGIKTDFAEFASANIDGEKFFRKTVAALHSVDEDNVTSTTGGSQAIFIAASIMAMNHESVSIPVPEYEPMFSVPEMVGLSINRINSGDFPGKETSFMISDPNNPRGVRYKREIIEQIAETVAKNNTHALIDEAFMDFSYEKPQRIRVSGGTIFSNTFSKFYGLGFMRTGYVISDEETIARVNHLRSLFTGGSSSYILWIAAQILQKRDYFYGQAKKLMDDNRKIVSDFADETGLISEVASGSAPYCFMKYRSKINSVDLCRKVLSKTGVLLSSGEYFGSGNSFRLCFTPERGMLTEAIDLLTDFFKALR
ncbi:MAG: pyridoxal phosphate-dependent aminotransferase [Thermoplasmataceae archaeon]